MTIPWSASTRPLPRKLQFLPALRVTRSELPFSCSRCHGSPASTWCPPRSAASPHLVTAQILARPQETPIQHSQGTSASRTDQPRFTAPALSGAEHHGTCGSAHLSQTTAPDSSTGSPARSSARTAALPSAESGGLAAPFWPLGGIRTLW